MTSHSHLKGLLTVNKAPQPIWIRRMVETFTELKVDGCLSINYILCHIFHKIHNWAHLFQNTNTHWNTENLGLAQYHDKPTLELTFLWSQHKVQFLLLRTIPRHWPHYAPIAYFTDLLSSGRATHSQSSRQVCKQVCQKLNGWIYTIYTENLRTYFCFWFLLLITVQ